jgi:gas vesicle protein
MPATGDTPKSLPKPLPTLWPKRLAALIGARRAELRQAVRVTVGCILAFIIDHLFNLPQGYWAVFTVVIVMQGSIGGTLSAAIDRMKGTLLGAAIGGAAAALRPQTPLGLGEALAVSVGLTALAAALRPTLKVAPVTAVIMLISPSGGHLGPLEAALLRVVEIFIGSVIGVATSVLVLPARSQRVVIDRVQAALAQLAVLCEHYADDLGLPSGRPDRHIENAAIRTALGQVEAGMADAARERSSRLSDHQIAEAMPRTLWRVRNDCVAAGRAVAALPESIRPRLGPAAAALLRVEAGFMRRCGAVLAGGAQVDRAGKLEALGTFDDVIGELRSAGVTQALGFDEAGPVFALAFALESLDRNTSDLADRVDETVLGRAETRPEG